MAGIDLISNPLQPAADGTVLYTGTDRFADTAFKGSLTQTVAAVDHDRYLLIHFTNAFTFGNKDTISLTLNAETPSQIICKEQLQTDEIYGSGTYDLMFTLPAGKAIDSQNFILDGIEGDGGMDVASITLYDKSAKPALTIGDTVKDQFSLLGDQVRSATGKTDKMTVYEMANAMNTKAGTSYPVDNTNFDTCMSALGNAIRKYKNITSGAETPREMILALYGSSAVPAKPNLNLIPDLYTNADTADTNWARFQVPGFELWDGIQAAKLKNGSVFGYKTAFPAGTYTYSFFAKLKQTEDNATATISFNRINPKTLAAGTLTTDWQRFSYTTTIASDTTGRFQVSPAGMSSTGTLLVAGQKVEKGSTMTDYVKRDGTTIDAPLGG